MSPGRAFWGSFDKVELRALRLDVSLGRPITPAFSSSSFSALFRAHPHSTCAVFNHRMRRT